MQRTSVHKLAMAAASVVALLLLAGIVFGGETELSSIGSTNTLRQSCLAIWAIVVPAWFVFEELWLPEDPVELKNFRRGQKYAHFAWMVAGLVVAAFIGIAPQSEEALQVPPAVNSQPASTPG